MAGLDDLIVAVRSALVGFTDAEEKALVSLFSETGIPADELFLSSFELERLTGEFNASLGRRYTGERLLTELLRLRKRGRLPRLRAKRAVAV